MAGGCGRCAWWKVWPTRTAVAGQPWPHGRSAGARAGAPGLLAAWTPRTQRGSSPTERPPRPSLWLACALRLPTRSFLSGLREGGALSQKGGLPEMSGGSRSASLEVTRKLKLRSLWAAAGGCPRFLPRGPVPHGPVPRGPVPSGPVPCGHLLPQSRQARKAEESLRRMEPASFCNLIREMSSLSAVVSSWSGVGYTVDRKGRGHVPREQTTGAVFEATCHTSSLLLWESNHGELVTQSPS